MSEDLVGDIDACVTSLYESKKQRMNLHRGDATLNIMVVRLDSADYDNRFHSNVGRDELVKCVDGKVVIELKYGDDSIKRTTLTSYDDSFFLIPMGVLHRIKSISEKSCILELIAGKFIEGMTVYEN